MAKISNIKLLKIRHSTFENNYLKRILGYYTHVPYLCYYFIIIF